MKIFKAVSVTFVVAAASMTANAAEESKVVYQGDSTARSVCMAIVKDDVSQLKSNLRSIKINEKSLKPIHESFRCNDLALDEFAYQVEATDSSDYLAEIFDREGNVVVEDVASL